MESVLKKVMFVGRATMFMVGLTMIVALTVGVAGAAFGANAANFMLGKTNTANAITQLVGSVAGPGLLIDNNSTDASASALELQVEPGKAPMKVNSGTQVANLNSDKVDGLDASQLGGLSGIEQVGVWCEPIFPDSAHSQHPAFMACRASNSTGGRYPRLECNLFWL